MGTSHSAGARASPFLPQVRLLQQGAFAGGSHQLSEVILRTVLPDEAVLTQSSPVSPSSLSASLPSLLSQVSDLHFSLKLSFLSLAPAPLIRHRRFAQ